MARQERAARTREALLLAAARQFEHRGYEGTSLGRVAQAVGVSVGALTFHFPSKAALAEAVGTRGESAVRRCVAEASAVSTPPLDTVVALTLDLVRLLEHDGVVRAAVRLWREPPGGDGTWTGLWLPTAAEALAREDWGDQHPAVGADDVLLLAEYLLAGAESRLWWRPHAPHGDGGVERQIARLWTLFLPGLRNTPKRL
ncbi:TetR family transcriptional regulator [Streptomyces albidoflavus]|uniref:TetR/AcrR family transcriptional regulator n=1 Tax=Streptomyces TaxID=1883 RepID=UPI0002493F0D|nr:MULTISPECIES: TetR/AcrR family transcriptional regulator [Streptomyces]MCU7707013.1 TetR/AcrR family transcriptional regulator [Streptomyces albidoflavus]RZD78001.1 TetR/AcrR family transcriptional regulator [Streptomyces albidoflavus]